jgi:hypothetical protein
MGGHLIAIAPCYTCRRPFSFHPDLVTSVPIDPRTGQPPDLGGTDPAEAVRQPLCPSCCRRINPEREARGLEPLDERDSLEVARQMGAE